MKKLIFCALAALSLGGCYAEAYAPAPYYARPYSRVYVSPPPAVVVAAPAPGVVVAAPPPRVVVTPPVVYARPARVYVRPRGRVYW